MSNVLSVQIRQHFPIATVEFRGVLDFDTAAVVRNTLRKYLADQPAALVVDLSGMWVQRPAALSVFRSVAWSASEWPGVPLILLAPGAGLRTALHRTGVARQMPIVASRTDAFALASSHPTPLRLAVYDLPPDPRVLRTIREVVRDACENWGIAETTQIAQLVLCELVSNAIEHAGTPCDVTLALRSRYVHVTVADGSPVLPRRTGPDGASDPHGRGLLLVDDLTVSWGALATDGGKLVWATVPVEPAQLRMAPV